MESSTTDDRMSEIMVMLGVHVNALCLTGDIYVYMRTLLSLAQVWSLLDIHIY